MTYELCIQNGKLIGGIFPDQPMRLWVDLEIPEEVCEIGNDAFYLTSTCSANSAQQILLNKIDFPKTLQHIGHRAFCESIREVRTLKFPTHLVSIGDSAFQGESKIRSLTIPNSVTSIGQNAFNGNKNSLTKIKLGKGLNSIGEGAFGQCSSVVQAEGKFVNDNTIVVNNTLIAVFGERTAFTVPDEVTCIGNWAFSSSSKDKNATFCADKNLGETSLGPEEIVLHEGVKRIGDYAFCDTRLKRLRIPESVEEIGANPIKHTPCESVEGKFTFENRAIICGGVLCAHIKQAESYAIPEGVSALGDDAFTYIRKVTEITLPQSVKHIGKRCFDCCFSLRSITLNEGLECIDEEAFRSCGQLTSIVFPATLRQLGNRIIDDAKMLKSITFLGTIPPKIAGELMDEYEMEHNFRGVVKVPAESLEAYKALFPVLAKASPTHPNGRILSIQPASH